MIIDPAAGWDLAVGTAFRMALPFILVAWAVFLCWLIKINNE